MITKNTLKKLFVLLTLQLFIYFFLFYLLQTFCPHLGSFYVLSSFTMFRPNFTSGLLQVILLWPRIGMLSLVNVSPVITAFHSCCLPHHVFDQVNLWPAWVGFETAIFWQCSHWTVETQRLNPLCHGSRRSKTWCDRQQVWKAVITGDTVTRLSIPIRGRGKSPEEGQRWNLAEA